MKHFSQNFNYFFKTDIYEPTAKIPLKNTEKNSKFNVVEIKTAKLRRLKLKTPMLKRNETNGGTLTLTDGKKRRIKILQSVSPSKDRSRPDQSQTLV